jgi:hypothetical protein
MSRRSFPYGDGRAAGRIALIVELWLKKRGKPPRPLPLIPGSQRTAFRGSGARGWREIADVKALRWA